MSVNNWPDKLGSAVTQLRRRKCISQEELSFISEVDRTYMSRIERGKANPTLNILERIAYALDVTVVELLEG